MVDTYRKERRPDEGHHSIGNLQTHARFFSGISSCVIQSLTQLTLTMFPGTGGVQLKKKNSDNFSRSSSPILLLNNRKKYQASVPIHLQEQDFDEDEDLDSLPESLLIEDNAFRPPRSSHKKTYSSPTVFCRCDSPFEQASSSSFLSIDNGFPPPEEVLSNDPIFHVVAVDVHSTGSSDGNEVTIREDEATIGEQVKNGISLADEEDVSGCQGTTNRDFICEEQSINSSVTMEDLACTNGNVSPMELVSFKSLTFVDDLELSTRTKAMKEAKVVGYFEGPDFACMKYTVSGKVWLWKRSEDLLVIKDDGRIIDPTGTKRSRYHKSYHQQVKSSIGKLYDLFFPKKEKESRISEKWATSSLDRHLGKPISSKSNSSKHGIQASLSTSDVAHCHGNSS
ncbi:unnamed protein product [Allacma fusca]|uniref:Uncharacterized protein n=1 Tax=Allacma fusca TaxID=39272 RepID=A0A8J2PCU5_9HEXA|nr:unnamed protein product [Allacma fusca]